MIATSISLEERPGEFAIRYDEGNIVFFLITKSQKLTQFHFPYSPKIVITYKDDNVYAYDEKGIKIDYVFHSTISLGHWSARTKKDHIEIGFYNGHGANFSGKLELKIEEL